MKIHWGKTEVLVVSRQGEECKVCVDEKEIEQVQNMNYLGTILSADGTCTSKEVYRQWLSGKSVQVWHHTLPYGRCHNGLCTKYVYILLNHRRTYITSHYTRQKEEAFWFSAKEPMKDCQTPWHQFYQPLMLPDVVSYPEYHSLI